MIDREDHVRTRDSERFGVLQSRVADHGDLWLVLLENQSGGPDYLAPIRESDLQLVCPFDGADVDEDWRACPDCKEII